MRAGFSSDKEKAIGVEMRLAVLINLSEPAAARGPVLEEVLRPSYFSYEASRTKRFNAGAGSTVFPTC
jgi:hypothetical protein